MKQYKAGIYLRLSKEDIGENNSIEAQRMITTEYAKKQGFEIAQEYEDNGYSGMLDSRPALNRMIVDIITNKINMVIVKDISRLTRDKNKTGYYTEVFFPDNDVRFISVTEMIDSGERYEIDDSIMLRGIVNQYYVADMSKKIKSVKTNLKKEGYFVEHSVPYGYKKEGEEKYKVLIDENVAENVKLIFSMYLQGYSQGKIAKHLTSLNIDTPKTYKGEKAAINEWRNDTIGRILKDPFYTGKIIINKYVNDYRIKKTKKTPRKDWIMVDGKHEPLISNEDFNLVQKMLQDNFSKPKQEYNYLLKGLVYCGHCKSRMQYKINTRKMKNDDIITRPTCKDNLTSNKILGHPLTIFDCVSGSDYYKCRMLYRFPSICNRGHTIMEKYLNEIVLESLKKRLSHFRIDEYTGKVIDEYKNNNANYKLLEQYKKKKKKLEVNITTLYNKKLEKIICVEDFKEEYANLKSEMKDAQSQIINLEKLCNNNLTCDKIKEIIVNFKKGKDFDNETMKILIDRIEVYEDMKIDIIYKI